MQIKNISKKSLILYFVCISILLMPFYASANNSVIIKGSVSNTSDISKEDLENSLKLSGVDKNGEKIDIHLMLDNNLFYQIELPEKKAETLFKCKNALYVSSNPYIKQPSAEYKYWDIIKNSNGKYVLSLRIFNIPCKKYKLELKWGNEFLSDKPCLDYELDFNLRCTKAKLLKEYNLPDTSENLIKNAEQYKLVCDNRDNYYGMYYNDSKNHPENDPHKYSYIYGKKYDIKIEKDIVIDLPNDLPNVKYKGNHGFIYIDSNFETCRSSYLYDTIKKNNVIKYKLNFINFKNKDEIILYVRIDGRLRNEIHIKLDQTL